MNPDSFIERIFTVSVILIATFAVSIVCCQGTDVPQHDTVIVTADERAGSADHR